MSTFETPPRCCSIIPPPPQSRTCAISHWNIIHFLPTFDIDDQNSQHNNNNNNNSDTITYATIDHTFVDFPYNTHSSAFCDRILLDPLPTDHQSKVKSVQIRHLSNRSPTCVCVYVRFLSMQDSFVSYLSGRTANTTGSERKNGLHLSHRLQPPQPTVIPRLLSVSASFPATKSNRTVEVANFSAYFQANSRDSNYGFGEEYEQLNRISRAELYTQERITTQHAKNRYMNITPCKFSKIFRNLLIVLFCRLPFYCQAKIN